MNRTFVIVVEVVNPRPLVVQNDVGKCSLIRRSHEQHVAGSVGRSADRRRVVAGCITPVDDRQRVDRGARRHQRHGQGPAEGRDRVEGTR